MPVFEYKCSVGHLTELRLLFNDKPPARVWCIVCNQAADRAWSVFSFRVKP